MKVIILDGVGLNLKTSILKEIKSINKRSLILTSDSGFYLKNTKEAFPWKDKFTVKAGARYLQMRTAYLCGLNHFDLLLVDRGIYNQIVWADLNDREVVDYYDRDELDYSAARICREVYQRMEEEFNPIRVLLETKNETIIRRGLGVDTPYDELDYHTRMRVDTFYDPDYYEVVQNDYINTYLNYSLYPVTEIVLEETEDISGLIKKVSTQILNL